MNKLIALILPALITSPSLYADTNFSGFWKGNCAEAFGLQIAPINNNKYSISFCGPSGCFKPGSYRPNTAINNDEMYQVVNSNHIKIKTNVGWSDYYKCAKDTNPKLRYKALQ